MLDGLKSWDWMMAFRYAGYELGMPPLPTNQGAPTVVSVDGCSEAFFTRQDVVEIQHIRNGAFGGNRPWMLRCRLNDGRYAALMARVPQAGWG